MPRFDAENVSSGNSQIKSTTQKAAKSFTNQGLRSVTDVHDPDPNTDGNELEREPRWDDQLWRAELKRPASPEALNPVSKRINRGFLREPIMRPSGSEREPSPEIQDILLPKTIRRAPPSSKRRI
jgi:hypothetical protein